MPSWNELPPELLIEISQFLSFDDVFQCFKVCFNWTSILFRALYSNPRISSTEKYLLIAETLLTRHDYASSVQILDLSRVIGTMKTVKLPEVMRACRNLKEFYVPQAAFTPHMIQALPTLTNLRVLDLGCCIERFEISRVINHCANFESLHTFLYPRCSVSTVYPIKRYPPQMRVLSLRGGLTDQFVSSMASASHPAIGIDSLQIMHCPGITAGPVLQLVSSLPQLRHLEILWPITRFNHNSMDGLLQHAPKLCSLVIAIDYISPRFFESGHAHLRTLDLRFSGVGKNRILSLDDIADSLEDDQHLLSLQTICISKSLQEVMQDDEEIVSTFRDLCQQRGIRFIEIDQADH